MITPSNWDVTVIIPVFGTPKLSRLLDSICRQSMLRHIKQVIIVDDATPLKIRLDYDFFINLYTELPLSVIYMAENRGPAAARNKGLEKSEGNIIFFTDDDCEPPADWIETHLRQYQQKPHISAVGGWYTELINQSPTIYSKLIFSRHLTFLNDLNLDLYNFRASSDEYPNYMNFPSFNTANLSVRKIALDRIKSFDERYFTVGGEDADLMRRLIQSGFIMLYIPQFVIHYKKHSFLSFLRMVFNRGAGIYIAKLIGWNVTNKWYTSIHLRCNKFFDAPGNEKLSLFIKCKFFILTFITAAGMHSSVMHLLIRLIFRRQLRKLKLI